MEITEVQDDTMEDTLTEANVYTSSFMAAYLKNFNATINFEKKTMTDFHKTMDLETNAFGYEL